MFALSCSRGGPRAPDNAGPAGGAASATSASAAERTAPSPGLAHPTRLLSLPVSAYSVGLGVDGELAYLLTRTAAYRLRAGKPAEKLDLDLGVGPVLANSGIIFWSKGAIWNASKESKAVWHVADVAKQPEYFVASDGGFAWLDRADDGPYRIQALRGKKPRVLVTSPGELSAVHMIHEWIYFVQRGPDSAWRIGRVHVTGSEPQYTDARSGPTPATLTGTESATYYDMGRSAILQLTPDLKSEHVWLKDFVCSPIYEAKNIYCGRVEGLFEIVELTTKPRPLLFGRPETITMIRANSRLLVWTIDTGPDQLAVEMLPVAP